MIDQAIEKAIVCVDLNQNGICEESEPKSSPTDTAGTFRIQYQPATEAASNQARQSPMVAVIDTNAVDAQDPSSTATQHKFILQAPAAKPAQINPLTTLVQRNLQGGQVDLATAEKVVAAQLGIPVSDIYDYQSQPASSVAVLADNARTAAKVTAFALEMGGQIRSALPTDTVTPSTQLGRLRYGGINDYRIFTRSSDGTVNAEGYTSQYEIRQGMTAGRALTEAQLYTASPANSVRLTQKGWNVCDGKQPRLSTRGLPARTSVCDGDILYYGFSLPAEDVSGRSMAEVIMNMQTGSSVLNAAQIPYSPTIEIDPSVLGNATFPQGSAIITAVSAQLNQPRFINDTTTDVIGNFPTVEAMIAGVPNSGVVLATSRGTIGGLGMYSPTQQMRGAFVDGSTLAIYRCDVDANTYANPRNCTHLQDTQYTIKTIGGVKLIELANLPGTGQLRGYAEYNGRVYIYRQERPFTQPEQALNYAQRLNGAAWTALRTHLGLPAAPARN